MSAITIDGNEIAAAVRRDVAVEVAEFSRAYGRPPALHVVLAGDDPASAVYVRNKERAAKEVGIAGEVHRLPPTIDEAALVELVGSLSGDDAVDGVLVQLPLPKGVRDDAVLDRVDPSKDVDGFHPVNAGRLSSGRPGLVPCTPLGCMRLIEEAVAQLALRGRRFELTGARAVVVGRSNIVGKPVAQLLLAANATVTVAHSRTRNLAEVCRGAEILVVAIGRAEMIRGEAIGEGAIVIDVGMNRIPANGGKTRLVGDVAFTEAAARAAAITPVPGGVGPMTIAMLLQNTVRAAKARRARRAG